MTPSFHQILLIFLSVDALALLILLLFRIRKEIRRNRIRHFGDRAEEAVAEYIEKEFPGACLMNNVFLKTERATTQIDHILLCKWGVFVIETKSHNGKINIEDRRWVQIYKDKVVRFHSPIKQNESHVRALVRVLSRSRSLGKIPVKGIVVFTSKKVHFSKRCPGVIRLEELSHFIKSGGEIRKTRGALTAKPGTFYLNRAKIQALEKWIRKMSVRSRKRKREHERAVRSLDRSGI